jgi:nucleotide-binding universal stress UspA family protein
LCPVNLTSVSHDALLEAAQVALAFRAELVVMHVVEENPPVYSEIEIGKWVPPSIREHTHYRELYVRGNAAERILETANQTDIDLIVLGAQHKRFSDSTVVGETTERITRFARQPVLTVVRQEESVKTQKRTAA